MAPFRFALNACTPPPRPHKNSNNYHTTQDSISRPTRNRSMLKTALPYYLKLAVHSCICLLLAVPSSKFEFLWLWGLKVSRVAAWASYFLAVPRPPQFCGGGKSSSRHPAKPLSFSKFLGNHNKFFKTKAVPITPESKIWISHHEGVYTQEPQPLDPRPFNTIYNTLGKKAPWVLIINGKR